MSISVTPLRDGDDYDGRVSFSVTTGTDHPDSVQSGGYTETPAWKGVSAVLSHEAAQELFGKLGDALGLIKANSDPGG